jgi:hypothetical protein
MSRFYKLFNNIVVNKSEIRSINIIEPILTNNYKVVIELKPKEIFGLFGFIFTETDKYKVYFKNRKDADDYMELLKNNLNKY